MRSYLRIPKLVCTALYVRARYRLCAMARGVARAMSTRYSHVAFASIVLVAAAVIALVSSGCGPSNPDPVARGSISATWVINDLNQQPATCARVGAGSVVLRMRNRSGVITALSFPCAANPSTGDVIAGPYDVAPELHAPDGTVIATAPEQLAVTISAGRITTLTPIAFRADTRGVLVLSLAAPLASNCKPRAEGGAGITGHWLTLEITNDGCESVTFRRQRGNTALGTYTVSCSAPMVVSCIEKDETLTASVPSGSHVIRVSGKINGLDCWRVADTIDVPPPGGTLVHVARLVLQPTRGCSP